MTNLNTAVLELHQKGYSYNQIAKELGISKSKAYRIINETVDVSKNETIAEHTVSKPFQKVPEQSKKKDSGKEYNPNNLKLQVKLRQMELEHEAEMKRLEFEEQEKKRNFELENSHIQSENLSLKKQIENLKQQIFDLENEEEDEIGDDDYGEEDLEDDTSEEEYIPELDIMIKDEIKEFLSHILGTDKYYKEDLKELISTLSNFKIEIIELTEDEGVDPEYFPEFKLLKKTEEAIKYYLENFDDYRSFWGSTINIEFEKDMYSQIEEYANEDIGE